MTKIHLNDLQKILASQPFVFDSPSGHLPFLLVEPSPEQWKQLSRGDGHASIEGELKKRHSSTLLAVNFHLLFQRKTGIRVLFEDKVAIPLRKSHKKANLDVSYTDGSRKIYVESKFLEPFYDFCGNRDIRTPGQLRKRILPYLDENRYPAVASPSDVRRCFEDLASEIRSGRLLFVDIQQLFKHALAIHRAASELSPCPGTRIVLQSIRWQPTSRFLAAAKDCGTGWENTIREREAHIQDETEICRRYMSRFIGALGDADFFTFEDCTYNERIDALESDDDKQFRLLYFL